MAIPWEELPPQLLATFLGAALGIPAGLWLDRMNKSRERRLAAIEDEKRLRYLSENLDNEMVGISIHISLTLKAFRENSTKLVSPFNTVFWRIHDAEFLRLCKDDETKGRVVSFYHFVRQMQDLLQLHRDYSIGMSSALGDAARIRAAIVDEFGRVHTLWETQAIEGHDRLARMAAGS